MRTTPEKPWRRRLFARRPTRERSGPRGMLLVDGRFHAVSEPPADGAGGEFRPPEMPASMPPEASPPGAGGAPVAQADDRTEVYLTIDAEDDYFATPHLLTGEGLEGESGAYGILEILGRHDVRATFFVNVYEAQRHSDPAVVERLVKAIAEQGHEVALHTHPSADLDFYSRPLFRYSADEQKRILSHGADLIERWSGSRPVSFRAGGYALNDATFEALEALDIRLDSSCFFTSDNNWNTPFTLNAIRSRGAVTEVPVMCVARAAEDGSLDHRKFDLNWLNPAELDRVVDCAAGLGIGHAMFMMHSFSFIRKESFPEDRPATGDALYRSPGTRGRYVEIYGTDPELRTEFERFVQRLSADPRVEVRTLASAEAELRRRAQAPRPDIIPVV